MKKTIFDYLSDLNEEEFELRRAVKSAQLEIQKQIACRKGKIKDLKELGNLDAEKSVMDAEDLVRSNITNLDLANKKTKDYVQVLAQSLKGLKEAQKLKNDNEVQIATYESEIKDYEELLKMFSNAEESAE